MPQGCSPTAGQTAARLRGGLFTPAGADELPQGPSARKRIAHPDRDGAAPPKPLRRSHFMAFEK